MEIDHNAQYPPIRPAGTFPSCLGKKISSFDTNEITKRARNLRYNSTNTEKILWTELRNKKLGVKFRRQHPLIYFEGEVRHCFITDFICLKKKLIIEIDGEIHNSNKKYDLKRTSIINQLGFNVIRFSNKSVYTQLDRVISEIKQHL